MLTLAHFRWSLSCDYWKVDWRPIRKRIACSSSTCATNWNDCTMAKTLPFTTLLSKFHKMNCKYNIKNNIYSFSSNILRCSNFSGFWRQDAQFLLFPQNISFYIFRFEFLYIQCDRVLYLNYIANTFLNWRIF